MTADNIIPAIVGIVLGFAFAFAMTGGFGFWDDGKGGY
jgi:hypothetical protein